MLLGRRCKQGLGGLGGHELVASDLQDFLVCRYLAPLGLAPKPLLRRLHNASFHGHGDRDRMAWCLFYSTSGFGYREARECAEAVLLSRPLAPGTCRVWLHQLRGARVYSKWLRFCLAHEAGAAAELVAAVEAALWFGENWVIKGVVHVLEQWLAEAREAQTTDPSEVCDIC